MRHPLLAALMTGLVACSPAPPGLEVYVKTNHAALVDDVAAGGGPTLDRAMDLAGIPESDQPTRALQLRTDAGLYDASPGALVTALTIYGR